MNTPGMQNVVSKACFLWEEPGILGEKADSRSVTANVQGEPKTPYHVWISNRGRGPVTYSMPHKKWNLGIARVPDSWSCRRQSPLSQASWLLPSQLLFQTGPRAVWPGFFTATWEILTTKFYLKLLWHWRTFKISQLHNQDIPNLKCTCLGAIRVTFLKPQKIIGSLPTFSHLYHFSAQQPDLYLPEPAFFAWGLSLAREPDFLEVPGKYCSGA